MRRNLDLCRSILLIIEELGDVPEKASLADVDDRVTPLSMVIESRINQPDPVGQHRGAVGANQNAIDYHLAIMEEGGLISRNPDSEVEEYFPWVLEYRLTWKGHEFLETVRGTSLWERAKRVVLEKSGGAAFDLVWEIAKRLVLGMPG